MTETPGVWKQLFARKPKTRLPRTIARVLLGGMLAFAGISHLTVARVEFRDQVPDILPLDPDLVVIGSGFVEIVLGAALIALPRHRVLVGFAVALFFIAVFPGNIAQWLGARDGFGLDTDAKRFGRLFFQPVLVLFALWSTAAWRDRPRLRSRSAAAATRTR